MGVVSAIALGLQLVLRLLTLWTERDKERRRKKKEILEEAKEALRSDDHDGVIAAFDRVNRLR